MLNLDTHIVIYALEDRLKAKEKQLLSAESWGMSAIVLWEISKLFELKRVQIDLDDSEVIRALSKIHVWPIDLEVCRAIRKLDFRGDPADEIIAATSIVHRVPLVTRDAAIRASRKVPLAL